MSKNRFQGSEYFKNLDTESDKSHYKKKLSLKDGTILQDPWNIESGWVDDISQLPDIMFGDIYCYLINTPSEFTGEKMKAFKSLEAYKYFLAGHVQDISIKVLQNYPYRIIKTKVT